MQVPRISGSSENDLELESDVPAKSSSTPPPRPTTLPRSSTPPPRPSKKQRPGNGDFSAGLDQMLKEKSQTGHTEENADALQRHNTTNFFIVLGLSLLFVFSGFATFIVTLAARGDFNFLQRPDNMVVLNKGGQVERDLLVKQPEPKIAVKMEPRPEPSIFPSPIFRSIRQTSVPTSPTPAEPAGSSASAPRNGPSPILAKPNAAPPPPRINVQITKVRWILIS